MKILIQRVDYAKLYIKNNLISKIDDGFLVFIGIEKGDENKIDRFIEKILKIKIIEDDNGKFTLSLKEKTYPILLVSQITLIPDFKDNKPNFSNSPPKEEAKKIFEEIKNRLIEKGLQVESGIFGEFMEIENKNIGPVSFFFEI